MAAEPYFIDDKAVLHCSSKGQMAAMCFARVSTSGFG